MSVCWIRIRGFLHRSDRHSHELWLIGTVQSGTSRPGVELWIRFYLIVLEETIAGGRQANLGQLVPPFICDIPRNDRGHAAEKFLDHDMIVEHRRYQHNVPQ